MAFDRFNDKPSSRGNRFSERGPRQDRFSDRRDVGDHKEFGDRKSFGGRFEDRFSDRGRNDRTRFGSDRSKFSGKRNAEGFEFIKHSGPRAKAFEVRRHADRNAFIQTATVRLDVDVAEFFKTPEAVNEALRHVIALAGLIRSAQTQEAQVEVVSENVQAEECEEELTATTSDEK